MRIEDDGSLVIARTIKDDVGRYQCSASNVAAVKESRPIRLRMHGKLSK